MKKSRDLRLSHLNSQTICGLSFFNLDFSCFQDLSPVVAIIMLRFFPSKLVKLTMSLPCRSLVPHLECDVISIYITSVVFLLRQEK